MNEIKSVVSVIKILERTIGILENCNDIGEIPDVTRKRVVEMLHKAMGEIYFPNKDSFSEEISERNNKTKQEYTIETPVIPDSVEETVSENTDDVQPDVETIAEKPTEENVSETVPEEETIAIISEEETVTNDEVFENETVIENVSEKVTIPEEEIVILEEEIAIPEEEIAVPEEEIAISEEEIAIPEEEITIPEDATISEEAILGQQDVLSDKPLFEWEIDKSEPVKETQETSKDDEINKLKFQLEEERKRLEQELQNWQDEKQKRDEEILATKKLLENLQQQVAINQNKQQSVPQPQVVPQPQQVFQPEQPSQQFQQPAKTEPLIATEFTEKPVNNEETQESVINRFGGTKKVLHENFETNNIVNHISTPVSNLSKAIGINDRFRFIKELFGGDSDLYNETIKKLDTIGSLVSAISYIESNFSWDKNNDSVKQLISLVRRRYM